MKFNIRKKQNCDNWLYYINNNNKYDKFRNSDHLKKKIKEGY
jgi:hypothetical protein